MGDTDENNHESQSGTNGDEITTATPILEGTIKDIQGKQLTVVESITEKADNGGDIMVGPGSGDDSQFNKVTVTWQKSQSVAQVSWRLILYIKVS